jgi:hypothetical protein
LRDGKASTLAQAFNDLPCRLLYSATATAHMIYRL